MNGTAQRRMRWENSSRQNHGCRSGLKKSRIIQLLRRLRAMTRARRRISSGMLLDSAGS